MMIKVKDHRLIKRLRKTRLYHRLRSRFSPRPIIVVEDPARLEDGEVVRLDWPKHLPKPRVGLVQDFDKFPHWTKYERFLRNNNFDYEFYNIHAADWLERARSLDVIVGFATCEFWDLQELREKYFLLERYMGKKTYPASEHMMLYEDKKMECYIAATARLPFASAQISHDYDDALRLAESLELPVVSKIIPGSASIGTELLHNRSALRRVVDQAFSAQGRKSYCNSFRQKNYVYFQKYIPNDGYDIRVIVTGNRCYGYYRKVPHNDFRASGMGLVEKRALPEEAMHLALQLNAVVKSPLLVVDFVHALAGSYYIIEFSPICQMETPEQLHVNGVAGAYIWDESFGFRFEPGRHWLSELALREFLVEKFFGSETLYANQGSAEQLQGCR